MKFEKIGILESKAYVSTIIDGIHSIKLSAPLSVQYEISGECNQSCIFCYNVWKDKNNKKSLNKTLSSSQRQIVIKKLIDLDIFEMIFSGGEPLLIPELDEIISALSAKNIKSHIISNGISLSEKKAVKLKEAGLSGIQISLHSPNPNIHDSITDKTGSFQQTLNGIKNAIKFLTSDCVSINMVLNQRNYTEIEPMMTMLKNIGANHFSASFVSQTGLALAEDISIDKKFIVQAFHDMLRMKERLHCNIGIAGGFPLCIFNKNDQEKILAISSNMCDAGLNQLVIAPNGDIRACVCFPQILGNILKDDPKEIWKQAPFLKFLQNLEHVPKICYNCDLVSLCKGGCRAAAYSTYNNFENIDPIIQRKEDIQCKQNYACSVTPA